MDKLNDKVSTILLTTALYVVAFVYLFPLLWLLVSTIKPGIELFSYPLNIFPDNPTLDNYEYSCAVMEFMKYFSTILIYTVVQIVFNFISSVTCVLDLS